MWKIMVINCCDSIEKALLQLNRTGTQFLAVCDQNLKLVGTITDGDIRRGLLLNISIKNDVKQIMNNSPKFITSEDDPADYSELFRRYNIKYLPVVDMNNKVINILSEQELRKKQKKENIVLLMAGGLGTRLKPLTNDMPKPLLPINGAPILEHIVKHLRKQGFYKFIFSVNYKKEMIIDFFKDGSNLDVDIKYLVEEKRMGTAGPLSLINEEFKDDLIVMNGDLITNLNFLNLLDHHKKTKNLMTVAIRQFDFQIPYGVVNIKDNLLINMEEKPVVTSYVNAGIYILNPNLLSEIPKDTFFDMPELIQKLLNQKKEISTYAIDTPWLDIGQIEDYKKIVNKPEEYIVYD